MTYSPTVQICEVCGTHLKGFCQFLYLQRKVLKHQFLGLEMVTPITVANNPDNRLIIHKHTERYVIVLILRK